MRAIGQPTRRIPTNNLVFVLALTPSAANVIVSATVLNKTTGATVVQSVIVDTPAKDPSLSPSEFSLLTGLRACQDAITDPGAPWTSGTAPLVCVFQDTSGTLPPARATFDNLEMRAYDAESRISIEPAVRLIVRDTGMNYTVEQTSDLEEGLWSLVQATEPPGQRCITVPASSIQRSYRLVPAP